MAKSESNQVRNQTILEEEYFYSDPDKGEISTWINKQITFDFESEHKLELLMRPSFAINVSDCH